MALRAAGELDEALAASHRAVELNPEQPLTRYNHAHALLLNGYLKEGLMTIVLDQAPEVQARRAIDLTLKRLGLIDTDIHASGNIETTPVGLEQMCAFYLEGHPIEQAAKLDVEELAKHDLILLIHGSAARRVVDSAFAARGRLAVTDA